MTGMIIAFKNVDFAKGILRSDWIGFKNFEYLFKTPDAFRITRNTLLYNVAFIIVNLVIGVLFAILLSELHQEELPPRCFLSLYGFPIFPEGFLPYQNSPALPWCLPRLPRNNILP